MFNWLRAYNAPAGKYTIGDFNVGDSVLIEHEGQKYEAPITKINKTAGKLDVEITKKDKTSKNISIDVALVMSLHRTSKLIEMSEITPEFELITNYLINCAITDYPKISNNDIDEKILNFGLNEDMVEKVKNHVTEYMTSIGKELAVSEEPAPAPDSIPEESSEPPAKSDKNPLNDDSITPYDPNLENKIELPEDVTKTEEPMNKKPIDSANEMVEEDDESPDISIMWDVESKSGKNKGFLYFDEKIKKWVFEHLPEATSTSVAKPETIQKDTYKELISYMLQTLKGFRLKEAEENLETDAEKDEKPEALKKTDAGYDFAAVKKIWNIFTNELNSDWGKLREIIEKFYSMMKEFNGDIGKVKEKINELRNKAGDNIDATLFMVVVAFFTSVNALGAIKYTVDAASLLELLKMLFGKLVGGSLNAVIYSGEELETQQEEEKEAVKEGKEGKEEKDEVEYEFGDLVEVEEVEDLGVFLAVQDPKEKDLILYIYFDKPFVKEEHIYEMPSAIVRDTHEQADEDLLERAEKAYEKYLEEMEEESSEKKIEKTDEKNEDASVDEIFEKKESSFDYNSILDSLTKRSDLVNRNTEILSKIDMWKVEPKINYRINSEASLDTNTLVIKKGSKTIGEILNRNANNSYTVKFGENKIVCWASELAPVSVEKGAK